MDNKTVYIVRGLTADGSEKFYTGRAGDAWVSPNRGESFGYVSQEIARNKALQFNRYTQLHGLRFVAVAY